MVNWDRLSELREEVGEDDLAEVVTIFCEEVEEVLAILDVAAVAEIPNHLHFLKGSALNIGFKTLTERCQREEAKLKKDPNATLDILGIRSDYISSKAELEGLI